MVRELKQKSGLDVRGSDAGHHSVTVEEGSKGAHLRQNVHLKPNIGSHLRGQAT